MGWGKFWDLLLDKAKEYWLDIIIPVGVFAMIGTVFVLSIQNNWLPKYTSELKNVGNWDVLQVLLILVAMSLLVSISSILLYRRRLFKRFNAPRGKDLVDIGIKYYRRQDLDDLIITVADSEVLYCLWHGANAGEKAGLYESNKIRKLLFIAPENSIIHEYDAFIRRSYPPYTGGKVAESILPLARRAQNNGIPVRVTHKTPTYQLIISNPNNDNAWAQVMEFNLHVHRNEQKIFIVYKLEQPYLFKVILDYFDTMWEQAKTRDWLILNEIEKDS